MVLAVVVSAARVGLWPLGTVPYSQIRTTSPTRHRDDCSGYVSMILGLATPGLSTVGLRSLVDPIPASQLRRGDLLGNLGPGTDGDAGHVQWVDNVSATGAVTVYEQTGGSAGPHRNTYKSAGFPAWRLRGTPTTTTGVPDMLLIRTKGTAAVYVYNGQTRTYQGSPTAVEEMKAAGVPFLDVKDVATYGIEFDPREYYADIRRARAADEKVLAGTGGGEAGGGITVAQVEEAAFRGAQRAEKE